MRLLFVLIAWVLWLPAAVLGVQTGAVVAYSLREADANVSAGISNKDLSELAGITRFAGFVYDAEGHDIILVGKVLPDLPAITLDDLVVGLRSRLIYNEWPLVSIDPTKDTEKTRQQTVRLEGHLAGTRWGLDFVNADVVLKKHCLKTLEGIWPVRSYRDYFEDAIREQVRASGAGVTSISWLPTDTVTRAHLGQGVRAANFSQCRFWFYPTERQRPVYRDGVFCIKELRLGVQPEEQGAITETHTNSPGTLYAQAFSSSFEGMSAHEPLSRLKGLYDLISIAEAIHANRLQSVVFKLISAYPVAVIRTPTKYPLKELVGIVRRTDGLPQLVRLAGGINFRSEIRYLQGGDVTPLRAIVTKTRPSPHALTWVLPLNSWKMPNMDTDVAVLKSYDHQKEPEVPGCSFAADSVVFQHGGQHPADGMAPWTGFHPFEQFGGVSFDLNVNGESFHHDNSIDLLKLKESVLKTMSGGNLRNIQQNQ